jgi:hypothetical protein
MTLGSQSKRGKLALGLIAAALCALSLAPASAFGAGDCEYCVDIPGGDGNGQSPTANASGGSGGGSDGGSSAGVAPTTPTTDTGVTDDSSDDDSDSGGGGKGGGGKGGGGNDKALSGKTGDRHQDSLAPTDERAGFANASDSDDGGFPVILVAIAVLAAAGVGFAAWRLRRGDGDGVGRPAQPGHSA